MKFFRKPLVNSVRKRFAWLPHKMYEMRGKWIATGQPDINYEPGWHYNGPSALNFSSPPRHTASSRRRGVAASVPNMGRVTPVSMEPVNWYDHWIWLEHYLERLNAGHNGAHGVTQWIHCPMPEQWNVWDEYSE